MNRCTWVSKPSRDGIRHSIESDGVLVATVYDERDAKLIAAAPDLLEIAKTTLGNVMSLHGRWAHTEVWIDELERAIAKAEAK